MYGFVDTTESATGTLMSIQTIFNDNNLDDLLTDEDGSFITLTVSGRGEQENDINLIPVSGMHGTWEEKEAYRKLREINVKYKIKDKTNEGFRKRFERLKSYLTGSKQVLEFTDEDAIFYATLSVLEVPEEETNDLVGTITFLCSDPDKYGPEKTEEFTSDSFVVENNGTAESDPIFELTAKKKATFAMIANGADEDSLYNLIGAPADVDVEVVNDKTQLFEERGQTLDSWTDAGTEVDGGVVAGNLGTDNDGITVPSYGSDTSRWHGPALIKEIDPVQDFEIEMMLEGRTTEFSQTFRIEFYAFDENMNSLGKMAIKDDTLGVYRKKAEARFGPSAGVGVNFPINKDNYQYSWDFFFGMLRMRRKGNEFEFYVTRINNNHKHVYTLKETFIDSSNQFMGKLRYIQIHIGKFGETERAYGPKIQYIKTSELHYTAIDQTPYILHPDDVITFDHKDDDILVNGEPRNDLKNFGGSFFKLEKGYNSLITWPPDTFETKVIHRDKFL